MKHYNSLDSQNKHSITFEKFSRKKESSAHKTSATHRQHWRQERKNVRQNKRYGEFV